MTTHLARHTLLAACLALTGCHTRPPSPPPVEVAQKRPALPIVEGSKDLPRALYEALTTGDGAASKNPRLLAAIRYQLGRARRLYERGSSAKAAQLVFGSLLLLKDSAGVGDAFRDAGDILLLTAHEAARQGDSGRARALYELSMSQLDSSVKAEVLAHVKALDAFEAAAIARDPSLRGQEMANAAIAGALVNPSARTTELGYKRTSAWLRSLLAERSTEPPRTAEAFHRERELRDAIVSSVAALVSISLREGNPSQALHSMDEAGLEKDAAEDLRESLAQASQGAATSYVELYQQLDAFRRMGGSSVGTSRSVFDAGLFGASWLAARTGEVDADILLPFVVSLVEFEMGEIAAHVLGQLAAPDLSRDALGFCMELGLRAMLDHAEAGEIGAAERAFAELAPLLDVARGERFAGIEPSPATLGRILAEAEVQAGRLEEALPRLEISTKSLASPEGYVRLGTLQLKLGKKEAGLATLDLAIVEAKNRGDLFAESVGEISIYRALVRLGQGETARPHLERALARILAVRAMEISGLPKAAIERQLAGVLEYYGHTGGQKRAFARALDESRTSPHELRQTLIDMARSALVTRDLSMARSATHYAVELALESEDAIYVALWQAQLEAELGVESDGIPHQVFESAKDARGWSAHLRQWGLKRLEPEALKRLATTTTERAEAEYYVGMREKGDARTAALTRVTELPTLGLIEAAIAEALLAPRAPEPLPASLPPIP